MGSKVLVCVVDVFVRISCLFGYNTYVILKINMFRHEVSKVLVVFV